MAFTRALNSFQRFPIVLKWSPSIIGRYAPHFNPIKSYSSCNGNSLVQNIQVIPKIPDVNEWILRKSLHTLNNPSTCFTKPLLNKTVTEFCEESKRTVTRVSFRKGTRKSVKTVLKRFYRLEWGAWIRPRAGRYKSMYKKSQAELNRRRAHVFCTSTQSRMFDKMVTKFWRKPKYYVDDPYESYHKRYSFWITKNLTK